MSAVVRRCTGCTLRLTFSVTGFTLRENRVGILTVTPLGMRAAASTARTFDFRNSTAIFAVRQGGARRWGH
jgi:hypothetical protein